MIPAQAVMGFTSKSDTDSFCLRLHHRSSFLNCISERPAMRTAGQFEISAPNAEEKKQKNGGYK